MIAMTPREHGRRYHGGRNTIHCRGCGGCWGCGHSTHSRYRPGACVAGLDCAPGRPVAVRRTVVRGADVPETVKEAVGRHIVRGLRALITPRRG